MSLKVIVVVFLVLGFAALVILSLTRPTSFENAVDSHRISPEKVLAEKLTAPTNEGELVLDPFFAVDAKFVTPAQSFPAGEKAMASHEFAPLSLYPPLGIPIDVPDVVEMPWAWIGKLAPDKQAAVEKAFGDAASSFRARVPEGTGLDDAKLEASMAQLEQDIARRLKSILSPQEFEDYLLSLPDDALERLGFEKSGT
jgi:hypothetical protein